MKDADATTAILFLCAFALLLGIFWYCERKTRKRNRFTRNGWRVNTPPMSDASCRSGWRSSVQRGTRY